MSHGAPTYPWIQWPEVEQACNGGQSPWLVHVEAVVGAQTLLAHCNGEAVAGKPWRQSSDIVHCSPDCGIIAPSAKAGTSASKAPTRRRPAIVAKSLSLAHLVTMLTRWLLPTSVDVVAAAVPIFGGRHGAYKWWHLPLTDASDGE